MIAQDATLLIGRASKMPRVHVYPSTPLHVNAATRADLMLLGGIGRVWADRIIAARPFKTKRETMRWVGERFGNAVLGGLALGLALPNTASAQVPLGSDGPSRVVVAGEQYGKPLGGAFLFGKDYRDLWTAPIAVEVLDLRSSAGGLQIVRSIGGNESRGLALRGADGRDYSFRPVKKDLSGVVPVAVQDSVVTDIIQDQIAATVPGVEVIKPVLARAVGVLAVNEARLVVLADDPILGEYRKDFAGALGVFLEYPQAKSATNPGFRDATEILGHTEFWDRRRSGTDAWPDTRAFLRARLLDLFLNDWDRHHGQWRWARIPGESKLQPIPEDADMALSNYEGAALGAARFMGAPYVTFRDEFSPLYAVTKNGWDVDRFLLTDIEQADWMAIAHEVQAKLTDDVIESAIGRLPARYRELMGAKLVGHLKARRDNLVGYAERFYKYLAADVDVHATSASDAANVEWLGDGALEVTVSQMTNGRDAATPYYYRRFTPGDTKEVRIYLHDGDDRVAVRGRATNGIKIRIIGGGGDDVVERAGAGHVTLYDSEGRNRIASSNGLLFDARTFQMPTRLPPNDLLWVPSADFGRVVTPILGIGYSADPGAVLGGGVAITRRGFRKYPWASHQTFEAQWATAVAKPFLDYTGSVRAEGSNRSFLLRARFSGIEQLRYYGLGNETEFDTARNNFYGVSDYQTDLFPAVGIDSGNGWTFVGGPFLQYSDSGSTDADTALGTQRPLGFGKFGHLGLRAEAQWNTRKGADVFSPGVTARMTAKHSFPAWDAGSAFGSLVAEFSAHGQAGSRMFWQLRSGGTQTWGNYPFFEAAYLGHRTTAGFGWNRFAGDASLFGEGQLDFVLAKLKNLIPGEFGVSVFTDVGRVFLDGEGSNKWHPSGGAGLFYAAFQRTTLFGAKYGKNQDRWFVVFEARLIGLAP